MTLNKEKQFDASMRKSRHNVGKGGGFFTDEKMLKTSDYMNIDQDQNKPLNIKNTPHQ